MGANDPKLHLIRYLQALAVPRHHTSEFCFSSKSRLEACSERLRVRDHAIHEARLIDRVRRILCDFERPQEERKVDEDRAIRDVLSGADSTNVVHEQVLQLMRRPGRRRTSVQTRMKGTSDHPGFCRHC